jgi:nicotinate phosphoribosyltransferase
MNGGTATALGPAWSWEGHSALLTDLYQLTMVQAYWREKRTDEAVFSLYVRDLPPGRNFLLACGLDTVLDHLERFRFEPDDLDWLVERPEFEAAFGDWLADFRFTGTVRAMSEGTPAFREEPMLEVRAPLPEAQLVETLILNQMHVQTLVASKAARVVLAARGRPVVEFGLRRIHGADAGIKAARASYLAGAAGTSNVLAGRIYGIPLSGTMAHSYVQAHDSEMAAFRAFAPQYQEAVLLVDTYDTEEGVRNVVRLAQELGDRFAVRSIRLDSGDLAELASSARQILDEGGLTSVRIFASGGLDEAAVAELVDAGAPIDGFGVGTRMGVSADAPSLEMVYKLAEYGGSGRLKLSSGKRVLPGPKQVFRVEDEGVAAGDTIGRADEALEGAPLLEVVMRGGRRLETGIVSLDEARAHAIQSVARLPERIRRLAPADPPYPVAVSPALEDLSRAVRAQVASSEQRS